MKPTLFRIITIIALFLACVLVYLMNMNMPIVVTVGDARVQYHASSVFVPEQSSAITWKADGIDAIYFNEEGVIGEGSQDIIVSLCESNRYPLDVTLTNDETLSLNIEPGILLFDPLFVGLLLAFCFQLLMFLSPIQRLTKLDHSIRAIWIPVIMIVMLSYLLLPIAEIALKSIACT